MRRTIVLTAVLIALASCTYDVAREFEGSGRVRGTFRLGNQTLHDGGCRSEEGMAAPCWVEMIELTGPPGERCGPGDCGAAADALLAGVNWNPGRWRVMPPSVDGWNQPAPFVIVVERGKLTTFQADYEPA